MAKRSTEHSILSVQIDNFKGIKKCPHCGKKPKEMLWEDNGIRMGCGNHDCTKPKYVIFVHIPKEELSLQKMTRKLIDDWNQYCINTKARLKANG